MPPPYLQQRSQLIISIEQYREQQQSDDPYIISSSSILVRCSCTQQYTRIYSTRYSREKGIRIYILRSNVEL